MMICCSQGSNWKHASIGFDNGLAPIRRQAIIRTDYGLVYIGLSVLKWQGRAKPSAYLTGYVVTVPCWEGLYLISLCRNHVLLTKSCRWIKRKMSFWQLSVQSVQIIWKMLSAEPPKITYKTDDLKISQNYAQHPGVFNRIWLYGKPKRKNWLA